MKSGIGIIILLVFFATFEYTKSQSSDVLEVYVIAHSHDDVGWIITMNQYFESRVQYIYDTVVMSLMENPSRKFSIVEVGFLKMWWEQATDRQKDNLKYLYNNGQVEFLIGGIVMNDEAAATYEAIINQMQEGHLFLSEVFGAKPSIGWQVDPFGSSKGTPTLLSWDCFDALIIDRIPYLWKEEMQDNQTLEFVWKGTTNLGEETEIFTHVMDKYMYCNPRPFKFGEEYHIYFPPNPNPPINDENIAQQSQILVDNFKERSAWFATNHLLWPFGCDFNYQNAETMFKNMDKLISYINEHEEEFGVKVKYSHVKEYFQSLNLLNRQWPTYSGDFFPYNDQPNSYWTGYYSSRSELKIYAREADSVLRAGDISSVLTSSFQLPFNLSSSLQKITKLREESGVAQHHDAIAGTARPNVIKDYLFRLFDGITQCNNETSKLISQLSSKGNSSEIPQLTTNSSIISSVLLSNFSLVVTVFNSLPYSRSEFVHINIPIGLNITVLDSIGNFVNSQIDSIYGNNNEDLLFWETNIPGFGFDTYFITPINQSNNSNVVMTPRSTIILLPDLVNITNNIFGLTFSNGSLEEFIDLNPYNYSSSFNIENNGNNDNNDNFIDKLINKLNNFNNKHENYKNENNNINNINNINNNYGRRIKLKAEVMQYTESTALDQPGGAYVFRNMDNKEAVNILEDTAEAKFYYLSSIGPFVQSFQQLFYYSVNINRDHENDPCGYLDLFEEPFYTNTSLIYRAYKVEGAQTGHIEVNVETGPITGGRDLILRYSSLNISSGAPSSNLFYQDDSGFQTMKRTFDPNQHLPIPGNYYPVVNSAYIEDETNDIRLTVLTGRAHAGASLKPGQLELILHRRTLHDDRKGVWCPLDDISRISFTQRVTLNTTSFSESSRQSERLQLNYPQTLFFGKTNSPSTYASSFNTKFAPLRASLPLNLFILSLQFLSSTNDKIILRLQHLFEEGSDPLFAVPITIDVNSIFNDIKFTNLVEMAISANQEFDLCVTNRMKWNSSSYSAQKNSKEGTSEVTIQPGQIKTFSANLSLPVRHADKE